ncbi:methyltransferase domain-containing protein [Streptomyces sp. 3MP-14]|uniref:Methyltransferase domain-containing protein n=1 Tax=Streptomyces mimosae TaxID=2586635 RepID=A0A5N5ZZU3_9ACTN|nr:MULTISPECIES: class I SAM-dependent methyltransferase [Streptomyces]KAB8162014.1 methyltransferase domain-containing protein [Streptomyces mimosae]KAB8173712.1 methyltransferase domain-containing protein [Streptomyces sp. 3MP-14]
MHWYEDDDFWVDFAPVMFSDRRRAEIAELVATAPLFDHPPGTRVLDLACGPALYAVPLARRGCHVTGVDLSRPMLDRARAACAEAGVDVRLVRGDMLTHVEPETYDEAINVFTSFGYFERRADNLTVLRNVLASLRPGGRLLVDVMGREVVAGWIGRPQVVELPDALVFQRDTILDEWTRLRTDWTLVREDRAREVSITAFLYSAAELRALFAEAGFVDIEVYGDFDRSPYDQRARRLVVRGTRPADSPASGPDVPAAPAGQEGEDDA